MKLVINAIPIRPGGGLTVVMGLLDGLRRANAPLHITVLCSAEETHRAIRRSGHADQVERVLENANSTKAFLWQNMSLGPMLRQLDADVLLTVNHYLAKIHCPQIVYHLNLRRFSKQHRSARFGERLQESVRDWSARLALRHADINVFESKFLMDAANEAVPLSAFGHRVIYIGLPDDVVDRATMTGDAFDGAPRLLAVTSPLPHKDNPTLLRTLHELNQRAPGVDWQLDIAGGTDPKAWTETRRLAVELGVAQQITWHGYCDHEKLDMLLRRSLCLVSTSQMESFAMVALEAMARRCPPVVAEVAAMPESVGPAGMLVPPADVEQFADAVLRLFESPAQREEMVDRGVQWIQDFRWSTCGRQFLEIFCDLTNRRAAA